MKVTEAVVEILMTKNRLQQKIFGFTGHKKVGKTKTFVK